MVPILAHGFLTGLLLQIAIGPVFFFLLSISLQRTLADGLIAVGAATIVDYLFIALAIFGVGKLLEKPKAKVILGVTSSIVLILFGIVMIMSIGQSDASLIDTNAIESDYLTSFMPTFVLTISSPLTVVFWTSLFAAKAIEKGYHKKQLLTFGIAAGTATFAFLGISVIVFSFFKASLPIMLLSALNPLVGFLLIGYGLIRLFKLFGVRPKLVKFGL